MNPTSWPLKPVGYAEALSQRTVSDIDLVVVHCTELPDLATALEFAERVHYPETGTGNCGHYIIDRDGRIEQWVPLGRVAHHVRGYNARSVGIELVNRGRYPDWLGSERLMTEPYPEPQLQGLVALLADLEASLPALRWIAGHEDLDLEWVTASDDPGRLVRRKLDPGPLFPWPWIMTHTTLNRFEPKGQ